MNVTPSFLCLLSTSGVISPLQVSLGLQLICFIRLQQTQDQFQEIIQDHGCFPVANYCCSFWYFVTFILPWNGKEDMWCIECIKDLIYYIFFFEHVLSIMLYGAEIWVRYISSFPFITLDQCCRFYRIIIVVRVKDSWAKLWNCRFYRDFTQPVFLLMLSITSAHWWEKNPQQLSKDRR